MLPNGQVLLAPDNNPKLDLYTPNGGPQSSWEPQITGISREASGAVILTGTQINGISQGALWGDDSQSFTNFPIIQSLNGDLGAPYLRTFDWTSDRSGLVSASKISGFGMKGSINYTGSQLGSLTVAGGQGVNNVVNITGTGTPSTLMDLGGLSGTSGTEDVGSAAPSLGGSLANIQSPLTTWAARSPTSIGPLPWFHGTGPLRSSTIGERLDRPRETSAVRLRTSTRRLLSIRITSPPTPIGERRARPRETWTAPVRTWTWPCV